MCNQSYTRIPEMVEKTKMEADTGVTRSAAFNLVLFWKLVKNCGSKTITPIRKIKPVSASKAAPAAHFQQTLPLESLKQQLLLYKHLASKNDFI